MEDTFSKLSLSAVTALSATVVKFTLVSRNKGDGEKSYLVIVDEHDQPFPGDDVIVGSEKQIDALNDTGGHLAIFLQKNSNTGVPGSPYRDAVKLVKLAPGESTGPKRVRRVASTETSQAFTFTAVVLTASGDLAFFDPRIIIKPQ